MSLLKEAFDSGKFGVTAEMAPPKGWDFTHQLADAELLKGKVHGINVTDMQSASMKATSLGLCIKLKQAGAEPIIQMTGRDRSRMVIMAEMLSAYSFGIDTMLALTGDHPTVGDVPQSKPVYDLDSVGILNMLSLMEETGRDCGGNPLAGNTVDKDSGEITDKSATPKFYKGACVTPVYEPMFLQINKLKQKVDA
ncbi:MAG: methylenetetrahydrofolate reductase, partial [Oscillospiraceae bacterium]|nr:methylenetetrahydrofolate reductase [Oscillospiraceae bacterium]